MSTSVLKASPGKLDIKLRHSPSILYISASITLSTNVLKAMPGKLDISKDTPLIFSISRQASRCQQAFSQPCLVNLISEDTHLVFSNFCVAVSNFMERSIGLQRAYNYNKPYLKRTLKKQSTRRSIRKVVA